LSLEGGSNFLLRVTEAYVNTEDSVAVEALRKQSFVLPHFFGQFTNKL